MPLVGAAERDFFVEHGWLVLRGVLPPERVAVLVRAFDAFFPNAAAPPGTVWQMLDGGRYHRAFARWLFEDGLGECVADVLDCARVQLLQDTLLCKPARTGGRVEWHQDNTYTGYVSGARSVSVRLALTPCTPAVGGMHVLDGSHRWGAIGKTLALSESQVANGLPNEYSFRVAETRRAVELAPGDVSIHHCLTFHASFENRSDQARKTVIAHVFDGSCVVDASRLPPGPEVHERFTTDADGHLVGPRFPVLYDSTTTTPGGGGRV